jgi:hypothetical protein
MLRSTNAYYLDYLSQQALLGDIQGRQGYYEGLNDVFNGSLMVEHVAWAVGEACADLQELYDSS